MTVSPYKYRKQIAHAMKLLLCDPQVCSEKTTALSDFENELVVGAPIALKHGVITDEEFQMLGKLNSAIGKAIEQPDGLISASEIERSFLNDATWEETRELAKKTHAAFSIPSA